LRSQVLKEVNNRFDALEAAIEIYIVKNDTLTLNAYQFTTLPEKLTAYKTWLVDQVNRGLLLAKNKKQPWLDPYLQSAFKLAVGRAYAMSKKINLDLSSFSNPATQQMLQLIYMRAYSALKGVTEAMDATMSRILAEGLAHGLGARQVAKQLREALNFSRRRAETIARTELINAYVQGQLQGFQAIGVTQLGVDVEWLTAGDSRVCPKCAANNGKVYTLQEAQGVLPLHPNCRCAWIPHVDINKLLQPTTGKKKK
jgi:SPP1 gp7 family putative phage head morphogenesis protein